MPLTSTQLAAAVRSNPIYGAQVGWEARYADIVKALGLSSPHPSAEAFAQAVADWQAKHPPLTPDGMIGSNTWTKLQAHLTTAPGGGTVPPVLPPPPVSGTGPRWLHYAQAELNRWEALIASWAGTSKDVNKAEKYVEWDELYFRASPFYGGKRNSDGAFPGNRNPDWCSAFVNWCLHRAGVSHTGSARAGSFLDDELWQFDALTEPKPGCVLVIDGGTHVTFLANWTSSLPTNPKGSVKIHAGAAVPMLGGNQSKRVQVSNPKKTRTLTAVRGQNGVRSPYLWPLRGESDSKCQIGSVPAEHTHFCGIKPR